MFSLLFRPHLDQKHEKAGGEPPPHVMPPSVSPDAPSSPLWGQHHHSYQPPPLPQQHYCHQQRRITEQPRPSEEPYNQSRRRLSLPHMSDLDLGATRAAYYANLPVAHRVPSQGEAGAGAATVAATAAVQASSIRRRPNRPGSAEDTGSGAE